MEGIVNKYGTMFIEKACDFEPYDYGVKGISTDCQYFEFTYLDDGTVKTLNELGFENLVSPKVVLKSWLDMLDECNEVEFNFKKDNYVVFQANSGKIFVKVLTRHKYPNLKYISKKDAVNIVKNCLENNYTKPSSNLEAHIVKQFIENVGGIK
ncbi:MAG: hypothetical protein ACRDBY_00820 [Cetobacterium sp.]